MTAAHRQNMRGCTRLLRLAGPQINIPLTNFQLKYHPRLLIVPLLLRLSLVFMLDVTSLLLSREEKIKQKCQKTCIYSAV